MSGKHVVFRSFEQGARHLFRHLDDARALQGNSLVADYFPNGWCEARGEDILLEIRADLLAAARVCHKRDVWSGRERYGSRMLSIITHLCNGKSPKQVAAELDISVPQFYRDRREAILGTTRAFVERRATLRAVDVTGELRRLQLDRIATLIDQGFARRASMEAETLLRSASTGQDAIVALCEYSYAAFQLGDMSTAKEACALARSSLREIRGDAEVFTKLEARIRLAEYSIASCERDPKSAYRIIGSLVADLDRSPIRMPEDGRFMVSVFLSACHGGVLAGNLSDAYDAVASASEIALRHDVGPAMESQIAFMRAFAGQGRASSVERLELLATALQSAQRVGSASGILSASLGLMDHCVSVCQEEKAMMHAEVAYGVARSMEGDHIAAIATDAIAAALMRTTQWHFGARVLNEVKLPATPYYALRKATYDGQLLVRDGKHRKAVELLLDCKREAYRLGQYRTAALLLPDLAMAQWKCGLQRPAHETAREALPVVEAFGSVSMVRLARETIKKLPYGAAAG